MATKTDKFIFYHIPRTGGTFVKYALRRGGLDYRRARQKRIGQEWSLKREHSTPEVVRDEDKAGRFSFCFVRHPLAWHRSFWAYRFLTGRPNRKFPGDRHYQPTFGAYLESLIAAYPRGFLSQFYQYYVGEDLDLVDFIGRQETLVEDLIRALDLSGSNYNEQKIRSTQRKNEATEKVPPFLLEITDELEEELLVTESWIMENLYE